MRLPPSRITGSFRSTLIALGFSLFYDLMISSILMQAVQQQWSVSLSENSRRGNGTTIVGNDSPRIPEEGKREPPAPPFPSVVWADDLGPDRGRQTRTSYSYHDDSDRIGLMVANQDNSNPAVAHSRNTSTWMAISCAQRQVFSTFVRTQLQPSGIRRVPICVSK